MNNPFFYIAAAACVALIFIESGIPHQVKMLIYGRNAYKRRLKPFDCHMCLAWWLGFVFCYFGTEPAFSTYTCMQAVAGGAISSVLAVLLYKIISK